MSLLQQVFNHVVLPLEIPGKQDDKPDEIGLDLVRRLRNACKSLIAATGSEFEAGWKMLDKTLDISQRLITGALTTEAISPVFQDVVSENGFAVLYLKEQNAALIMYSVDGPDGEGEIVFEAFEAAPRLETVVEAQDALRWDFPSRAAKISADDFCGDTFLHSFSMFLEKADGEQLSHLAEKINKAGAALTEIRDVVKPDIVTHMLLSLLQSMGGVADVDVLRKRVRDDANINGGVIPWRRLPLWLVLRVAAQRRLGLVHGQAVGYAAYKVLSCMLLNALLHDCTASRFPIALTAMLQKKLGRKMAKLETRLEALATSADTPKAELDLMWKLVDCVAPVFKASIQGASDYIERSLDAFKRSSIRQIPRIPTRALDKDLVLTLPRSGQHLSSLLLPIEMRHGSWVARAANSSGLPGNAGDLPAVRNTAVFTKAVVDVVQLTRKSKALCDRAFQDYPEGATADDALSVCSKAQSMIKSLMDKMMAKGIDNVELNSALILEVFDNWMIMDQAVTQQHALLLDYSPVFPPALLDVLQLPDRESMKRLRRIQEYLARRHSKSLYPTKTIFSDFDATCFATRSALWSQGLQKLLARVRATQETLIQEKTRAWERSCEEYDDKTRQIQASECTCSFSGGQRQIQGCLRCYKWRVRKRMTIATWEHLLPEDPSTANAVVFELGIPEFLDLYRQTTWSILTRLAYPQPPRPATAAHKLRDGSLHSFFGRPDTGSGAQVTLASSTKTFEDSHYRKVKMKAELDEVILPLGARYRLFDAKSGAFISDYTKPLTIAHLVHVHIPPSLRSTVLPDKDHPPTVPDAPSSYECVASRPKCPHHQSVHEFEAQQRLLSAKTTRWLAMLVELGSSNINLGKEDAMLVLSHLAHEAGPPMDDASADAANRDLGAFHFVFADTGFVQRLLAEVEKRLHSIRDNWRETNLMTLIITLLVRVDMLADRAVHRPSVMALLQSARSVTMAWVDSLRGEISAASSDVALKRASEYGFRAALLCRRTFELLERDDALTMTAADLEVYVRASITMQQNLTSDPHTLPAVDKAALRRDAVLAFRIEDRVSAAMRAFPESLGDAVLHSAGMARPQSATDGAPRQAFEPWTFPGGTSQGWAVSWLAPSITGGGMARQSFAFHYTQGHLLVDGKTMGKLPDNIRASHEFMELFGTRHMLTYPSAMPGMSHRLVPSIGGHMIHLGQHGNKTIVMSVQRDGQTFEFVPRRHFIGLPDPNDPGGRAVYDLPRRLVDDCVHWVNRTRQCLEMRKSETPWLVKDSDWILDIAQRKARRRNVLLVDPFSATSRLVAQVFQGFEDVQRLTVFQPAAARGTLSAELRHLELSFAMTGSGTLHCNELDAEIDPNQDAGALYGYKSMIVLRDAQEKDRRSIILPLAEIDWKRDGCHISVIAKTATRPQFASSADKSRQARGKAYARLEIDSVLGRLTCPPEPRILYTKAQLHAFTSTPVPDPLTGRTGEEEAMHTLLSGRCQPWKSLPLVCLGILGQMTRLVPQREYYPPDKRVVQKVTWNPGLPIGMHSDRYARVIRAIVTQADSLRQFEESVLSAGDMGATAMDAKEREQREAAHKGLCAAYESLTAPGTALEVRGEIQRMRYECARADAEPDCPVAPRDLDYTSLGHVELAPDLDVDWEVKCKAARVFQVAELLRTQPDALPMKQNISTMLNRWPVIGGFVDGGFDADEAPLSSLMESRFVGERWGSLVHLCRTAGDEDLPHLMFALGCLAFAPEASMDAVRLLAAYFYTEDVYTIEPPAHDSFSGFKYREELTVDRIMDVIEGEYTEYDGSVTGTTSWLTAERILKEERQKHLEKCLRHGEKLARLLMTCWPGEAAPEVEFPTPCINVRAAMEKVGGLWERLAHNRDLSDYVTALQSEVDKVKVPMQRPPQDEREREAASSGQDERGAASARRDNYAIPSIAEHLVRRPMVSAPAGGAPSPSAVPEPRSDAKAGAPVQYKRPPELDELQGILVPFSKSSDSVRQKYGRDLAQSLRALNAVHKAQFGQTSAAAAVPDQYRLSASVGAAKTKHADAFAVLRAHFSEKQAHAAGSDDRAQNRTGWLESVRLWPRLTPVSVLELLRSRNNLRHGDGVLEHVVHYGTLLADTQRLYRLRRASVLGDARRTREELDNVGHANWSPAEHPDWLLMEIDANMLIRDEQVTVARAMIAPQSQQNSVFQLNMGKGKTSVILPMVLAVLADGSHLARMLVPKSLILPTAHVIQSRLGGLVGRQVRHLAFSRRLISADDSQDLLACYKDTHGSLVQCQGMLIAAPEHILAFKLCGLQCLADGKTALGAEMVAFQTELEQTLCRDVLDESDFTLAVRTQLVYPSGDLTAVDGAPHRWQLVQQLLALIEDHALAIAPQFRDGLKLDWHAGTAGAQDSSATGRFPTIHILHNKIEDELHERLVGDVCSGIVPLFRLEPERIAPTAGKKARSQPAKTDPKQLIRRALTADDGGADVAKAASLFADVKAVERGLLLVRGLIKHGILLTCLKKRWNVQYGLHPGRWPIAVPYEARGVPSERSEFGHPDVSIIFTCLAFYYAGVDMEQFRKSLEHVLHHVDDPATEYEKWSAGDGRASLPAELQSWNAINVDDQGQVAKLWQHLRYARSVINHYLNKFVFPQHSRQFSVKLQASAWDLPLISDSGQKGARTTGFSGTNDNKSMLPLTIKQDDLPGFSHTNAEVSAYFLQRRNRGYVCTGHGETRWSERDLIQGLAGQGIRVLIDAGAYILELNNEGLARAWLAADKSAKAAVFFDEKDNRAMVVFREATAEKVPLVSSPYADRLDECVVYFDEAHTRGVDLQLPPAARGAVTLALGQTRDHTAQSALRLRQLATTQSVVFYAPPEVDQSIRDLCRAHRNAVPHALASPHVVAWLLEQTCKANEQLSSLYAAHGRDFCRRTDAIWTHRYDLGEAASRAALLQVLEQPERQTLETMYGSPVSSASTLPAGRAALANAQLEGYMAALRQGQPASRAGGGGSFALVHGAFEEVEQEREVEVQVEEEDIPERRIAYEALSYPGVADALRTFVQTGRVPMSAGCQGAFVGMAMTNIGRRHALRDSWSQLYVSLEYGRTIRTPGGANARDDFLRPTEWLLWCPSTAVGVVVITEELEELLPLVRASKAVRLVAYAAAVTRSMLDFSSLAFLAYPPLPDAHVFPPWLAVEMGILAGRLYMRYDEAQHMIAYLESCVKEQEKAGFCSDPSSFLLEWLPLRRTAQDILHTPAAYICQGRPLRPGHAFFLVQQDPTPDTDDSASSASSSAHAASSRSSPSAHAASSRSSPSGGTPSSGKTWDLVDRSKT